MNEKNIKRASGAEEPYGNAKRRDRSGERVLWMLPIDHHRQVGKRRLCRRLDPRF